MTSKKTELEKIEDQLHALSIKQRDLLIKKCDILKKTITLKCEGNCPYGDGCGTDVPMGEIAYIATQYYEPNTGSPNGGYWEEGEGNWICPRCGHRNRIMEDRKKFREMQYNLFKSWVKEEPDYSKRLYH